MLNKQQQHSHTRYSNTPHLVLMEELLKAHTHSNVNRNYYIMENVAVLCGLKYSVEELIGIVQHIHLKVPFRSLFRHPAVLS